MDRREGKKEAKRNGGCVTEILLAIEIILFLFVCELFIYLFIYFLFFLFNLCGFFFVILFFVILYLVFFVNFGGLSLPCHLLCCLLLFVYFYLFIYLFIYLFYLHGFSGFIFCKFNCSWHFFTSSDCVPPGGWLHGGPVSGTGIEG